MTITNERIKDVARRVASLRNKVICDRTASVERKNFVAYMANRATRLADRDWYDQHGYDLLLAGQRCLKECLSLTEMGIRCY